MRCFVAVELPDAVRTALARAADRLRKTAPRADVRWVPPGSMHLTLRFLGELGTAEVEGVRAALGAVAARHPPIALAAAGLGTFPGSARPRVVWAGLVEGAGPVGQLAAEIEQAVVALGLPPEPRPFRAHVTLGRVRSPRGARALADAVAAARAAPLGAWVAEDVVLFQSHLSPRGARYEALARPRLGGTAAPADTG